MMRSSPLVLSGLAGMLVLAGAARAADPDWNAVGQALGKAGTVQAGGVYRIGLPRTDIKATVDGIALEPGFALGGWVAFDPMGDKVMVMGDLVLTEAEVAPVMAKLESEGLQITALHNHLLRANPPTLFMHIAGVGDPVKLATALHDGLSLSKTPLSASSSSTPAPGPGYDTSVLEQHLGYRGKANGDVFQFTVPRANPVTESGMALSPAMGVAIGINFEKAGGSNVATTGDFILSADEVNPVVAALTNHGIEVTAIHSHMLDEDPRMFFLHFWGRGNPAALADGLRAALNKVNVAPST